MKAKVKAKPLTPAQRERIQWLAHYGSSLGSEKKRGDLALARLGLLVEVAGNQVVITEKGRGRSRYRCAYCS